MCMAAKLLAGDGTEFIPRIIPNVDGSLLLIERDETNHEVNETQTTTPSYHLGLHTTNCCCYNPLGSLPPPRVCISLV